MLEEKAAATADDGKGVAVAVVAISRFLSAVHPTMPGHLAQSLASAEQAGLASDDLAFLRMLVQSLSA